MGVPENSGTIAARRGQIRGFEMDWFDADISWPQCGPGKMIGTGAAVRVTGPM